MKREELYDARGFIVAENVAEQPTLDALFASTNRIPISH
jgi:hypothetical protein